MYVCMYVCMYIYIYIYTCTHPQATVFAPSGATESLAGRELPGDIVGQDIYIYIYIYI